MDKYKRYTGVFIFIIAVAVILVLAIQLVIIPQYDKWTTLKNDVATTSGELEKKKKAQTVIINKLKKLKSSLLSSQKKIYSPLEDKTGNDTLFFTLYSDLIEMVRANTIKIKSIDYEYNPEGDIFVQQGSRYFVCDVTMEVVSNYVNLGKLIQDIYQYPYYIKINSVEVVPYQQDKKILLSTISLRLYAHTFVEKDDSDLPDGNTLNEATTPLPQ